MKQESCRLDGAFMVQTGRTCERDPRLARPDLQAVPSDRVFALLTTSGGHLPSGLPTANGVNLSCGGAVGG